MSWRHVMVTRKAKLSMRNNQLVVTQDEEVMIPLEDIATILIEDHTVVVTASVLSQCSEHNITLFTCNSKHLPNGILNSFQQHSRQLGVLQMQYALSKPLKKRLWQKIVVQKILNQAKCLQILEKKGGDELIHISKTVDSGDTTNREAYAAKQYFTHLFGQHFVRRADNIVNISLNYGYSIMRGAVARALVMYGFLPCMGLDHHNELNNFNLADDFMEILRPVVDLFVVTHVEEDTEFDIRLRSSLYNLLNYQVLLRTEKLSIHTAVEEMVKSFVTACRLDQYDQIKLPEILPLMLHSYE